MMVPYSIIPAETIKAQHKIVSVFSLESNHKNIDEEVVHGFGEEWKKFHSFSDVEIKKIGDEYFDIVTPEMVNKNSYMIDIGCGTGRWSRYMAERAGFVEAVDPSNAIFVADKLLAGNDNIRLSKASTDTLPFADNTFDFGMSIGVLHHIPDTQKAMADCVKKIKPGGYFYTYLYYKVNDKSIMFRWLFQMVNAIRRVVSRLPDILKKLVCDLLAIAFYMPIILLGRFFILTGLRKFAAHLPLSYYHSKSFFIIRNDALDRFGTKLEQRFSKAEITSMMQEAGLNNVIISDNYPYWHAVGEKIIEVV